MTHTGTVRREATPYKVGPDCPSHPGSNRVYEYRAICACGWTEKAVTGQDAEFRLHRHREAVK